MFLLAPGLSFSNEALALLEGTPAHQDALTAAQVWLKHV